MNRYIGKCSICGGIVAVPLVWFGINSPIPTCQNCGAIKKENGPVIPMTPGPIRKFIDGTNDE